MMPPGNHNHFFPSVFQEGQSQFSHRRRNDRKRAAKLEEEEEEEAIAQLM